MSPVISVDPSSSSSGLASEAGPIVKNSSITTTGEPHGHNLAVSSIKGRPRSSSAASMISNLSEKIRLGSTGFFGRHSGLGNAGGSTSGGGVRSRAGSNVSMLAPPVIGVTGTEDIKGNIDNSNNPVADTSSCGHGHENSSTTTMAALASATAVASAMFMPRESVYTAAMTEQSPLALVDAEMKAGTAFGGGTGGNSSGVRRQSIYLTPQQQHPLAEMTHFDDVKASSSSTDGDEERDDAAEEETAEEEAEGVKTDVQDTTDGVIEQKSINVIENLDVKMTATISTSMLPAQEHECELNANTNANTDLSTNTNLIHGSG
ncbi:hypothetical protein BGZ94_002012 [Podila epigama]|nr:hypothetical protein BGZ94_002012 [Podila epigama]